MNNYFKAKEIMDMDAVDFVGGVSESEIKHAMETLSVVFPESYQAFLRDFGGGDAGGELVFGITNREEEEDDVVIVTQMERNVGLPNELIIIGYSSWNEKLICLDTGKMNHGECPVVEVGDDYNADVVIADTFGTYLYNYLNDDF